MEGGSVVANRVESEEYRELTSYEVFVCRGGGVPQNITKPKGGLGKFHCDITKFLLPLQGVMNSDQLQRLA